MENFQLIKALINIGLIGQVLALIYNIPPQIPIYFGKNKKKGKATEKYRIIVEFFVHITLPVALILTYNIPPTTKSLIYSAVILVMMFIMVLIFTPAQNNINAVYYLELGRKETGIKKFQMPFHTQLWLVYALIMCFVNFILQYLIYFFGLKLSA